MERLISAKEAAELLNIKSKHVYELAHKGLPFVLVGNRNKKFQMSAITRWVENGGLQQQKNETKKK